MYKRVDVYLICLVINIFCKLKNGDQVHVKNILKDEEKKKKCEWKCKCCQSRYGVRKDKDYKAEKDKCISITDPFKCAGDTSKKCLWNCNHTN